MHRFENVTDRCLCTVIYTCLENMNGAATRRIILFILLLLDSSATLPDGNRDQTRSAEAAVALPEVIQEKVETSEAPNASPDGNQNSKSAEAVVAAPEELAGAEAKSAQRTRSEDNLMRGRFLDLWKTLRADFSSSTCS
jgi:hypothetical protein